MTTANPIQQFLSHTFAFGTVLGIYLERARASRREPTRAAADA